MSPRYRCVILKFLVYAVRNCVVNWDQRVRVIWRKMLRGYRSRLFIVVEDCIIPCEHGSITRIIKCWQGHVEIQVLWLDDRRLGPLRRVSLFGSFFWWLVK